jgi:hypothetical protein
MRFFADSADKKPHAPELIEVGREFLRQPGLIDGPKESDHMLAGLVRTCLKGEAAADARVLAAQLLGALRKKGFLQSGKELLDALVNTQPGACLDVLFSDPPARTRQAVWSFVAPSAKPSDERRSRSGRGWGQVTPEVRFPQAALLAPLGVRISPEEPLTWSPLAKKLLHSAPDLCATLEVLLKRLEPISWGTSLALDTRNNLPLLDDLLPDIVTKAADLIDAARERLQSLAEAADLDEIEASHDDNESFE